MKYSRVFLDAITYELPPVVVTSRELETRLRPVYQALRMPEGQLEALTGIVERRWWEPGWYRSVGAGDRIGDAASAGRCRGCCCTWMGANTVGSTTSAGTTCW